MEVLRSLVGEPAVWAAHRIEHLVSDQRVPLDRDLFTARAAPAKRRPASCGEQNEGEDKSDRPQIEREDRADADRQKRADDDQSSWAKEHLALARAPLIAKKDRGVLTRALHDRLLLFG